MNEFIVRKISSRRGKTLTESVKLDTEFTKNNIMYVGKLMVQMLEQKNLKEAIKWSKGAVGVDE
ncbi:hypothetical protein [Enterococcus sp. CWB-B31]|uniref:hypothetical protein n=1 Tax=Enterococcus sp. CWB-B31 TaxID=2885159 RepID=UPI001E623B4F|nr:hypothetical protein [Enterococcus sp. CWB-B31]MCB5956448.1 hypothetical protein [Enterococcus sp. CWB-B31]